MAVLVASAVFPFTSAVSGAQTGGDVDVTRLAGFDRYATSLAVAERFEQEAGGSIDAAVVVSGMSWHDAVIAAGLAGSLDAPVLLTLKNEVPTATADFLSEAGVSRVVVVGSPSAVSDQVLASLASLGNVERVSGPDPSAASVALAQRMGSPGVMPGHGRTVVVAGSQVFADAMVAGPFSARGGHPVLLTAPDVLDEGVKSYVTSSDVEHVIIMGGTAAVSNSVHDALEALGVAVTRLGGSTRLHTAQLVAEFLEGKYSDAAGARCFDRSTVGLATARVPFDAFSAGPLLGEVCAPLLLTDPKKMDPGIERWINEGTDKMFVFGGEAAVSPRALAGLNDDAALEIVFDTAADERAKIVANLTRRIKAGSYGVNARNVLRGPAGFTIDLDYCARDWSDTAGITDTQIRIGHTAALSGPIAGYDATSAAMQVYFDWVNENDPVAGRQIRLVIEDDGSDVGRSIEHVDAFLRADNVFSILTTGTSQTRVSAAAINGYCVPHALALSAHPTLGDPVTLPWTTGMQLSFSTEAALWGEWIERNLPRKLPVKVTGLVLDTDLATSYEYAFEAWAEENPGIISRFVVVRHDPAATTLTEQLNTAKSDNPDVYISMTAGLPCLLAMRAAGENGLIADVRARGWALFTSSGCKNAEAYLEPAGEHADGWWIVGGGAKDTTDPDYASEPFIKLLNKNLRDAGFDPSYSHGVGFLHAYTYVEALRVAAELPGGLSRSNFILAVRSLDITHPLYLDGIRFRMNGNTDAYFVEGSEFAQYDADDDAWTIVGPVIDVNGKTPICTWDWTDFRCR